jgi:2',3'-cyclic-nucleotide 2'-phosphodiesterase (5'-nucleotidase family)
MRSRTALVLLVLAFLLALPAPAQPPVLTVLHFNDVYQLTAVDGGRRGGFDRLATVVKTFRARA